MADAAMRTRRVAILLVVAIVAGIAAFVLRGPGVSNALKKVIVPELEMMSGRRVSVERIYINLFPLFAEARQVKVFDDTGGMIVSVPSAKAYVDLAGLPARHIIIRRLVIKRPQITSDRKQVEGIIGNVKAYLAKVRKPPVKVRIKAVEVRQGNLALSDDSQAARIKGLSGEIIIGKTPRINASAGTIDIRKAGWPDISVDAEVNLVLKDGAVEIKRLVAGSFGSQITAAGEYGEGKGTISTGIDLLFSTVKRVFNLKREGTGQVSAKGIVTYSNGKTAIDLKLAGNFYVQTLLELLKVKDKIEGLVNVEGEVKGPLDNLRAKGSATVKNGNFYNVAVDYVKCDITYADGQMKFTDGIGRLYNGKARIAVMIHLPVVNYYSVDVNFDNVDSAPVFKLIGWDPGVESGKVKGTLKTEGSAFNPAGRFEYRSVRTGSDILGRIAGIAGGYELQGQMLTFPDLGVNTGRTEIRAAGSVDIAKKVLALDAHLKTSDITDVSAPYYGKLKGAGEFGGTVRGTFDDPVISGNIRITNPVFESYSADVIDGSIAYSKEAMTIGELTVKGKGEHLALGGGVYFRKARKLFDFSGAEYQLKAALKNADMGRLVKIFYPSFKGTGSLQAELKIGGMAGNPGIVGNVSVVNATVYDVPFDSAAFVMSYTDRRLGLAQMKIVRGKSVVRGNAGLDDNGTFSFDASSDKLLLSDIVPRKINGDAVFSVRAEGSGTLDNPSLSLSGKVVEGLLRGKNIGSGSIAATIKQKDIMVRASMINDGIEFTGKGRFEKDIPWEGRIDIKAGRYDSLIGAFLKDVPEDLILSLNGAVLLHGDRNHVTGNAEIKQVMLSMYGYSFTNEKEINMELNGRSLRLNGFRLRSGDASLKVGGSLVVGKQYNLSFEGSSSLAPFKSLSSKIALLRGDADVVLSVSGDWDNPQINGGVTMSNGAFGLKDVPYRVSSLGGYVYMDNDRIVIQRLSGKMGGGDIDLSGVVYLKKFSFDRFYVDAKLSNITTTVSNEFNVNFGGDLLLKGTPSAQGISGDITINRARYRERVEWKSWLLKTKKTEKVRGEISAIEKAQLNVRVTGKDNITIDNNIARAAVTLDMVLRGTIYRPILLGRLETKEGTVYFRNNDFRILHASADFTDPNKFNPYVSISADTTVSGYRIMMNLDGQFDHFNVSFSSDPVLKEMDILSLLTAGQTGTEMKGLEGSIGASEAAGFVTGKLQDVLEERLKTITGFDRFQIDPHVSRITGTVEPQFTVSKKLMGDKMFVTYATTAGSKNEQIIKLEYYLTKTISLVGLRDERGIIGGDVTFRFKFK
jgi:translocation and assembly module TamB